MRIQCPVCKAETKVSGFISFNCTSCGRKFSKPVPRKAKDSHAFILTGAMAMISAGVFKGISASTLGKLAPILGLLGAGAFFVGIFQRFNADKTDLIVQEESKGKVVREYSVIDLDRQTGTEPSPKHKR